MKPSPVLSAVSSLVGREPSDIPVEAGTTDSGYGTYVRTTTHPVDGEAIAGRADGSSPDFVGRVSTTARGAWIAGAGLLLIVALTGCVETPALSGGSGGYSSVGPVTEIAEADRGDRISFSGTLETGEQASSETWLGQVLVVNFWYASCAPCRAEAPDLQALYEKYQVDNVQFVGVNVRDQAGTAEAFATSFGITYPSFVDADSGAIQLAFAGQIAPNAVPTTLVLDRDGRVASRIIGQLDLSTLDTLIGDAVAEP